MAASTSGHSTKAIFHPRTVLPTKQIRKHLTGCYHPDDSMSWGKIVNELD
jgi:hypothetical protein